MAPDVASRPTFVTLLTLPAGKRGTPTGRKDQAVKDLTDLHLSHPSLHWSSAEHFKRLTTCGRESIQIGDSADF